MTIYARFGGGRCPGCDRRIEKGERIVRDDEGDWLHEGCVYRDDIEPERGRPRPICPRCWMETPCFCEETP